MPLPKADIKVPEGIRAPLNKLDRGRHIQFTVFNDNDKFPITVPATASGIEDTLQDMGYMTLTRIAMETDISFVECLRRVRNLERIGLIKRVGDLSEPAELYHYAATEQ